MPAKKIQPQLKAKMHARNKQRERYDFDVLLKVCPELSDYSILNLHQEKTIDFSNPKAVKLLNKALLKSYYDLTYWDIPENYLCPPIPGRADYIHHIADLLCSSNFGNIPTGEKIVVMDIGVGANCIYPIIGNKEYGWSFIATDIDTTALENAKKICEENQSLKNKIDFRLQTNSNDIFYGIINKDERFDLTICNPPFHSSAEEATKGSLRKVNNLNTKKTDTPVLNFGGQSNELWCVGGEKTFIKNMIRESKKFGEACYWFSTLVSKEAHLKGIYALLKEANAIDVKTIAMGQGNKSSRIVAWTFLTHQQQKDWKLTRWK